MPPKRRAAAAAGSKAGGKKAKQEETPKPKDAFTSAKEALLAAGPQVRGKRKVDDYSGLSDRGEVRNLWKLCHSHAVCQMKCSCM